MLRTLPQPLAIPVQNKRYGYKYDGQKPQYRARPPDALVLVHGRREKREPGTETRSHKIVAREHRGGVIRVCVAR